MRKSLILSLAASLFLPVLAVGVTAAEAPAGATTIVSWPDLLTYPGGQPGLTAGMATSTNGVYASGYTSGIDSIGNGVVHGMQYTNGVGTDLGTLGTATSGQSSYATGVNNSGTEVGYDILNPSGGVSDTYRPVEWTGGHIEQLTEALGTANGINDSGTVIGSIGVGGSAPEEAVTFSPTGITSLGEVPNPYVVPTASAEAINDAGVIVGNAATNAATFEAVTFSGGSAHPLPNLPGQGTSGATSVSQYNGYIDGVSTPSMANGPFEATQFGPGPTAVPLGFVPGYTSSYAKGVNSSGVAVGYAINSLENGTPEAAIFANGQAVDLNSYLPANSGWVLQIAQAINDNGQIVGSGIFDGQYHGFTMTLGVTNMGVLGFLGHLIQNLLIVLHLAPHTIS